MEAFVKHLLTIAGSDCSGGAGIQADLKTFSAFGCYGMSVICAVTAQNTQGLVSFEAMSPRLVEDQIDAIFQDIPVHAVKLGMLANAAIIRCVARKLREYAPSIVVLDPVMRSKSGHRLLADEAEAVLKSELIPLSSLLTPNLPEAEALCGFKIQNSQSRETAACMLKEQGAQAVLIKGGHRSDRAEDYLMDNEGSQIYDGELLDARHSHGTGCSLSSALASLLAQGHSLKEAVKQAKDWISQGIREGLGVGKGCGPIHHFHEFYDAEGRRR